MNKTAIVSQRPIAMQPRKYPGEITTQQAHQIPEYGELIAQADSMKFFGASGNEYLGRSAAGYLSLLSDDEFKSVTGFTKADFYNKGGSIYFIPAKEQEANSIHEISGEIVLADDLEKNLEKLKKKLKHELTHWGQIQRGETPTAYYVSPEDSIKKYMEYLSDPKEVKARFNEEGRSQKEYEDYMHKINWSKSGEAAKLKMPDIGEIKVQNINSWRPSTSYIREEVNFAKKGMAYREIPRNQLKRDIEELEKILPENQEMALARANEANNQLDIVGKRKPVSDEDASNINLLYHRIKYDWQMNRLSIGKKSLSDDDIEYIEQPTLRIEIIGKVDLKTGKRENINPIMLERFLEDSAGIKAFAVSQSEIQIKLDETNLKNIKKLGQILSEGPRQTTNGSNRQLNRLNSLTDFTGLQAESFR